jgi:hypothetical protein
MRRFIRDVGPRRWLGSFLYAVLGSYALWAVVPSQQTRAPAKTTSPVEVVGHFLKVKHAGDDAFGYSLRLWKEGNQVFGLLGVYIGAPADPPIGILEDVKFDLRTRQFSFSARLSIGWVYAGGTWNNPTRDRYSFSGVLTRREVTGILKHSDEFRPTDPPTSERIRLRRSVDATQTMSEPTSFSEWKTYADKILRRSGPRW